MHWRKYYIFPTFFNTNNEAGIRATEQVPIKSINGVFWQFLTKKIFFVIKAKIHHGKKLMCTSNQVNIFLRFSLFPAYICMGVSVAT